MVSKCKICFQLTALRKNLDNYGDAIQDNYRQILFKIEYPSSRSPGA